MNATQKPISPWLYILTLYLPFGLLEGGLKTGIPNLLFKQLGYSNQVVGLLWGLGLLATLRFVIAPWLDGITTKRRLSLCTLTLAGTLGLVGAVLIYAQLSPTLFLWAMVAILVGVGLTSAAHETAADGYYIRALDPTMQAQFIGIKTAAIRAGAVFASMVLVFGATKIAAHFGAVDITSENKTGFHIGFSIAYLSAGLLLLAFALGNRFVIPKIAQDQPVKHEHFALPEVIGEYLKQRRVALMILLILLYRFGEGFMAMKDPFYQDPVAAGGLASEASDIPLYSLLTDIPWMILGGILGGYMIKWWGLKRTFIPLAAFMNLPNLFYVWLAYAQPMTQISLFGEILNVNLLYASSIESLGYGMSFSAMFYYMHIMATEAGQNKTSILAISFALMNIGWSLPGMLSGYAQAALGYTGVFLISSTVGLTALLIIPFLPMPAIEEKRTETKKGDE